MILNDALLTARTRLGFGCLHLRSRTAVERCRSCSILELVHTSGIRIFDTADSYCIDHKDYHSNERLLADCLNDLLIPIDERCLITKGGMIRPFGRWEVDCNPERLAETIVQSLLSLSQGSIDLWLLHAREYSTSITETLEPAYRALRSGKIKEIGLSTSALQDVLEIAERVPVSAVQANFSIWNRRHRFDGLLSLCEARRIPLLCAQPLGGPSRVACLARLPLLQEIARSYHVTVYALAIAWLLHQSDCVVPLISSFSADHIREMLKAEHIMLDIYAMKQIESASAAIQLSSIGPRVTDTLYYAHSGME